MISRALVAAVPIALLTLSAGVLAPAPSAVAANSLAEAAANFGLTRYSVLKITTKGDVSKQLTEFAKKANGEQPTLVYLPSGEFTVSTTVRPANNVYLVAETDSRITWKGASNEVLVRFTSPTGGVFGGNWSGGTNSGTGVFAAHRAKLQIADLKISQGGNHGLAAYEGSVLQVQNVTTTANKVDGVHLEKSQLVADGLTSTYNRRNGVQLSTKSTGTITNSKFEYNGQAVRGSTDNKVGHGLGLSDSSGTVSNTSSSRNKVCGVSLANQARVQINTTNLDHNGRHGLGTVAGTTAVINDSTAHSNGYHGVLVSGSGTSVSLVGMKINAPKQSGVSVPSGTASISRTTISGSGRQGVSVSNRGTLRLLDSNTITASKQHGIAISSRGSLLVSGQGNVLSNNRQTGLLVINTGTKGTISAPVKFISNRKHHVQVTKKAKLVTVKCSFSGQGGKGIFKNRGGKVTITN